MTVPGVFMKLLPIVLLAAPAFAPALADEVPSPAEDVEMHERAQPFIAFADQIEEALATGESGAFRASLSPTTLATWSKDDVNIFVDQIVMPFFADFADPVAEQWIAPTTHPAGFTGFAFYRSFTTADGRTMPFVIYILDEGGRLVVGNLLVGKTFQDMHPQQ